LLVAEQIIRQEIPVMIGASLVVVAMALDGNIGRLEAGVLFALVVGYTVFLVVQSRRASQATNGRVRQTKCRAADWDRHWSVQAALVIGGLLRAGAGRRTGWSARRWRSPG
jgi:cation:H+ antiporter